MAAQQVTGQELALDLSSWSASDWQHLQNLRSSYLQGQQEALAWTPRLLELYDQSLARRIGWKWAHVLARLPPDFWSVLGRQSPHSFLDWGCGSGVASEMFLRAWHECLGSLPASVYFQDKDKKAVEYSRSKFEKRWGRSSVVDVAPEDSFVVVSHVLSELRESELTPLLTRLRRSRGFVWVDSGRPEESQRLVRIRNSLRGDLDAVFPCPHSLKCPLSEGHDWCHFFAAPPRGVHQDPGWREFSTRMQMDLRRQAYSVLVMMPKPQEPREMARNGWRVLGVPDFQKGQATVLVCHDGVVDEARFQKREDPTFFREWSRGGDVDMEALSFVSSGGRAELKRRES